MKASRGYFIFCLVLQNKIQYKLKMQKEVGLFTHSCSFVIQPCIVGSSKFREFSTYDFSSVPS